MVRVHSPLPQFLILLASCLSLSIEAHANFFLIDSPEVSQETKLLTAVDAVPSMKCKKGGGAGVVISDNCHVLTNIHVIQRCGFIPSNNGQDSEISERQYSVLLSGKQASFKVIAAGYPNVSAWPSLNTQEDSSKDWAIIKLNPSSCGKCVRTGKTQPGDQVWALGYPGPTEGLEKNAASFDDYELANPPKSRPLYFSRGPLLSSPKESQAKDLWNEILSSSDNNFPIQSFLFADLPVNGGNSGGPLLNEESELLGITTVAVFNDIVHSGPLLPGNGAFLRIDEIKKQLPEVVISEVFDCNAK